MKRLICILAVWVLLLGCIVPVGAAAVEIDPDGTTAALDNRTSWPDGEYSPAGFSFSGGTGKVKISCDRVVVSDGLAYADIAFSSSSYAYVKTNGSIYYTEVQGKNAVVTIPIALETENHVFALTTKMSTPHEVEYALFVSLEDAGITETEAEETAQVALPDSAITSAPQLDGLDYLGETSLVYAQCFHLYRYSGGYTLISIPQSGDFLVVPENGTVPENLDSSITVLQQPLNRIYLAATSAMALFDALDGLDCIAYSGTEASGWYIENAAKAMEAGRIQFAGKYSEPDYEQLCFGGCNLAIESTMIYHTPKVKEALEGLGIPVIVDRSSYEVHPLGRTEWIKLYAALLGREAEAEAFFQKQAAVIEQLKAFPNTEKTVAFFYVRPDGTVVVRNTKDYIPQMIKIGGGQYLCPPLSESEEGTSIAVTMESFYASVMDADYLIYNSVVGSTLESLEQLIAKDSLFADFKAVQNNQVWCTDNSLYQSTDIVGQLILDIHQMVTGSDGSDMIFLERIE